MYEYELIIFCKFVQLLQIRQICKIYFAEFVKTPAAVLAVSDLRIHKIQSVHLSSLLFSSVQKSGIDYFKKKSKIYI